MERRCSWCNGYIEDDDSFWYHKVYVGKKKYRSKEKFCSPKCAHEYPYTATPDRHKNNGQLIIVALIICIWLVMMLV